jgi:prephenate dehydrogenase
MSDYSEVTRELKHIKALLAMGQVKDFETMKEKILFLAGFGFDDSEIARLVGSTPGSVAVARSQAKKKPTGMTKKT